MTRATGCDDSLVSLRHRRLQLTGLAALLGGVVCAWPAAGSASLVLLKPTPDARATFVGRGGYSADGLGQQTAGGSLQAEVPGGSKVVGAFLYGAYYGGAPTAASLTITFDGRNVQLGQIALVNTFLAAARADVTAQVAAKVGAGGGVVNFAVGNDPSGLDGLGLVVIYSNERLPVTTIAVLDGGAEVDGDTATFTFAQPVDPARAGFTAKLSIGSGHSYQGEAGGACGTFSPTAPRLPQSSTVDVNGVRLSSCTGNYDDGTAADGALITVGGVGDSLGNPTNPAQLPGDGTTPRTSDDELYDLKPLLKQGATDLTITTSNASKDDLVFLAVIAVTAEAGVTTGGGPSPPKVGQTFNTKVVQGKVTCRAAGSRAFKPVTAATQFRVGSECDASKGVIEITSATGTTSSKSAATQSARFSGGRFVLRQRRATAPVTELLLSGGDFRTACRQGRAVVPSKKVVRKLLGNGKGRFRTRGRYSTTTVTGTRWLTEDRCDGTQTTVTQGEVEVQDLVARKKVRVKKGKKYLAKAHRSRGRSVRGVRSYLV